MIHISTDYVYDGRKPALNGFYGNANAAFAQNVQFIPEFDTKYLLALAIIRMVIS